MPDNLYDDAWGLRVIFWTASDERILQRILMYILQTGQMTFGPLCIPQKDST